MRSFFLLRLLPLLLALVPPLVLLLQGYLALEERVEAHLKNATQGMSQDASRYLGRTVTIGKITPEPSLALVRTLSLHPGQLPVTIENIKIKNTPSERRWAGQDWLAQVPKVTLRVSVPKILTGDFLDNAIEEIRVERPEGVLVRNANGKFNVESILPDLIKDTSQPPNPPFQTRIFVQNGTLRFRDFGIKRPQENFFNQVTGVAEMAGASTIGFKGQLMPMPETDTAKRVQGLVTVVGQVERFLRPSQTAGKDKQLPLSNQFPVPKQLPPYYVRIHVPAVSLPYTLAYTQTPLKGAQIPEGWAGGDVTLVQGVVGAPQVFFAGDIRDTTVRFSSLSPPNSPNISNSPNSPNSSNNISLKIEKLQGKVIYRNGALEISGAAQLLGKTIRWAADATDLTAKSPVFSFRAEPFSLTMEEINTLAPLPKLPRVTIGGEVHLENLSVIGTAQDLQVNAHVSGLSLLYPDLPPIEAIQGDVQFHQNNVRIANVQGTLGKQGGGGNIVAQGTYDITQKKGEFTGKLAGVDLTKLVSLRKLPVRITGRGEAVVSGELEGKNVTLSARARGDQVTVAGVSLPLSEVEGQYHNGSWQGIRAKIADATGALNSLGSSRSLQKAGSEIEVNLRQDEDGAFVGAGVLRNGDLAALSQAMGKPGLLAGRVKGEFTLSGTAGAPLVRLANVTATNVRAQLPSKGKGTNSVATIAIDSIDAPLLTLLLPGRDRKEAQIALDAPVQLKQQQAHLTVRGEITHLGILAGGAKTTSKTTPELHLSVVGRDATLTQILAQVPAGNAPKIPLTGHLTRLSVQIIGPADRPQIQGDGILEKAIVGEFPIDALEASFAYNLQGKGGLTLPKIKASSGNAEVSATATLLASGELSGSWETTSLMLESLAYFLPKDIILSGQVQVKGRLLGTRDHPRVEASLTEAKRLYIAGIAVDSLVIPEVTWQGNTTKNARGAGLFTLRKAAVGLAGAGLQIEEARYDGATGQASLIAQLQNGSLENLSESLRQWVVSGKEGKSLLEKLDKATIAQISDIPRLQGQYSIPDLRLSARVTNDGIFDKQGHVTLSIKDFQVGAYTQTSDLNLEATLAGDTILLERPATLKTAETTLAAEKGGRIFLPQKSGDPFGFDLSVISNQASLDLIRTFVPSFPARGLVDVSGTIQGTNEKPQIDLRVESESLVLGNAITAEKTGVAFRKAEADVRVVPSDKGEGVLRVENVLLSLESSNKLNISNKAGILDQKAAILDQKAAILDQKEGLLKADISLPYRFVLGSSGDAKITNAGVTSAGVTSAGVTIPENKPLSVTLSLQDFDLHSQIAPDSRVLSNKVQGILSGSATISGTLATPELQGNLSLKNALLALQDVNAEKGKKQNPFNIIVAPEIKFALQGKKIVVEKGEVAVLSPRRRLESVDVSQMEQEQTNLTLSGAVTINNFTDLRSDLSGAYDLKLKADNIALNVQNITGLVYGKGKNTDKFFALDLGEKFTGSLNGELSITGPISHPKIGTKPGSPLELTKAVLQLPAREPPILDDAVQRSSLLIQPEFAIETEIIDKAEVKKSGFLGLQVKGSAKIQGDILEPKITADMETIKGDLDLRLLRFKVQPGGIVSLKYGGQEEGVTVRNLKAVAVVYQDSQRNSLKLTSFLPTTGTSSRHTVTATMNGPLDILGTQGAKGDLGSDVNTRVLTFSSDPYLSEQEILGLIGIQDFLDKDPQRALQNGFMSILRNSVLGSTGTAIESALRLDAFNLDFDPNGTTTLRLVRRLEPPNDRVTIDFTRRFQPHGLTGNLSSYVYGIDYEILKLRERRGIQPQLQVGVSVNDQRFYTYYLRGTVPFSGH